VHLLNEALRGLEDLGGYGKKASLDALGVAFREDWNWLQQPLAPLASEAVAHVSGAKRAVPVQSCRALGKFIETIERDQRSHKPGIPATLAKAWIREARAIESALGCGTLGRPHGESSKHGHGRSSRHNGHR
jgi:hypothetical protein